MSTSSKTATAKTFDKLSDILLNGIDIHRCAAATSLGKMNYPGSGQVLEKALLDEDVDVRTDVMAALVKVNDEKTGDAALENLLGDPCPEVKLSAIELLAETGNEKVIPFLLKLVTEKTDEIIWDEQEFYNSGWEDWLDFQIAAINALGKMGVKEAVPEIVKAMNEEGGQDVSHFAIPVLASLGQEGTTALASIYETGDERMRRRICAVLDNPVSEEEKELFARCLRDESGEVRYVAVEKLIDQNANDPQLIQFFKDSDADIRQMMVERLGEIHPGHVTQMFEDESPSVRQAVFRTVAATPEKFEKEGFSEVVRKAIAGVPQVAGDAAIAWAALLGAPSAKSLGQALQNPAQPLEFRTGLIEALTLLDEDGFPYLAQAAGDKTRQVRISALTALAEIAKESDWPNKSSEALLAALRGELVEEVEEDEDEEGKAGEDEIVDAVVDDNDEPEDENREAVSTLDEIMTKGINPETEDDGIEEEPVELDEMDEHYLDLSERRAMRKGKVSLDVKIAPHLDVKRFAARILGDFDEDGVQRALCVAATDPDAEMKQSAIESLSIIGSNTGKLDDEAIAVVLAEADNPDRNIRMLAARCMAYIDSDELTEKLVALTSDEDEHVRLEAIHALGTRDGFRNELVAALNDEYSGVRTRALKALAAKRTAMDELIDLSLQYDGLHRDEVIAEFKNWNVNEAVEKYLAILGDENKKRAWLVAVTALGDLLGHDNKEEVQAVA